MPFTTTLTFGEATVALLTGFGNTVLIFLLTLLFALPLGLIVCACSMSKFKPLKYLAKTFVWIIRGTPLLLQVLVIFYVPGLLFKLPLLPQVGGSSSASHEPSEELVSSVPAGDPSSGPPPDSSGSGAASDGSLAPSQPGYILPQRPKPAE